MVYCKICDSDDCEIEEHQFTIGKVTNKKEISGSSPPEIFVGRWNYPNVYTGILSPEEYGNTKILSSPEIWHSKKLSIAEILANRNKLIYGRTQNNIKNLQCNFISVMKEVAMTESSISTELTLKKPIETQKEQAPNNPLISRAAEIIHARLQENTKIKPKVDYLVSDIHSKSKDSIIELSKSPIETSTISKILSAGLLGLKNNRKLVPTRWSITAVDDTISKANLEKVRFYPEIKEILTFSSEYLGNHYEFLLLPNNYQFEVIEISLSNAGVWKDYESLTPRKSYADSVTGAYYANRLALSEYLQKIKRQASCLVIREIRPEYSSPLGVGILRQISREAFQSIPEKSSTLKDALNKIQSRLKQPISNYTSKSIILNQPTQKSISSFLI
ncbi:MAG: hypothetical protein AABX11_00020 [Nanoarchaeota archaeon]